MVNESGSLTFTGIALLTILALPMAVLAVPVLAMLRRGLGLASARAWRTSLAEVAIVYGTVPFVLLTMVPGPMAGLVDGSVSLVPLEDLPTMTTVGVVGNLLLFAAAGFFGPIRFRALRSVGRVLALGIAGSVTIETLQYTLRLDRVSSIDAKRRIAVLGEMLELGETSRDAHHEIGTYAATRADLVLTVGEAAAVIADGAGQRAMALPDNAAAIDWLRSHVAPGDVVLVKASRGARLDQVAAALV